MKRTLRISAEDFDQLRTLLLATLPKESACFLLAGKSSLPDEEILLIRRVVEIPPSEYRVQESYRLEISTRAINGIVALCERNGLGLVVCHSHPDAIPYSLSDDIGESRIAETIWDFLPRAPVWSLLFYPTGFEGRAWLRNPTRRAPLDEVVVIGRSVQKHNLSSRESAPVQIDSQTHDRQVAALGEDGQRKIASSRVAIVGLGGTGSPTAEQLARLGVADIVLVDKDIFTPSNKSRVYGSFAEHKRRRFLLGPAPISKVDLTAKHLQRIEPAIRIKTFPSHIVVDEACRALLDRDIVFLCTDDHWGRSVVNQVSYQYFIPTVNMGVRIDSEYGTITHAMGSIQILRPNKPCLWCYQYLNADQIRAESLPEKERKALKREGYIQGVPDRAPSVIPFTTWVSSISTTLFLQLVTDFMGPAGDISRINVFLTEGTSRRATSQVAEGCICTKVKGFGDQRILPTLEYLPF